MRCPKCNTEVSEDFHFCSKCGISLKPSIDISVTKTLQTPAKGFKKGTIIAKKYKIIEKIGQGGMGVVYKAKDTRLDRDIALKFLPPEMTREEEAKKRFVQEARAAAALNHPHICTIYEIDEADDQTFISMEYIEGESLKDKLDSGPLEIDEAKDIALQIAAGLEKAHNKGIVHRDIKPANIMINDDGQVKITDFGLAKLSWGVDLTKPTTIMGTVAYMSPEQAKGEKVDHRTDVWSLGAMLYEMLSGERPFQKNHEQALIYSILHENPTPLTVLRSDVPGYLGKISEKALQKKAALRYQTIADIIVDLKKYTPITFAEVEKSIIVLPFENLSPDKEQEYFCDGITEEIIADLSKIHSLRVISRTSAMILKGTRKSIKTIGNELDVEYVLEGSVRKAGNNLRITAQLIDAENDAHLWAEKYNGTVGDIFNIQEKVSRSIVHALKIKLDPKEDGRLGVHLIGNQKVFEIHHRARYDINTVTEDGFERAIELVENAIKNNGDNEILYADLGYVYLMQYEFRMKEGVEELFKKAEECIQKIFELNPDSSEGHFLKGNLQNRLGNTSTAVKEFKKALDLDPVNLNALFRLGWIYAYSGQAFAARPLFSKLLEIDPLTATNNVLAGGLELLEGNFETGRNILFKCYEFQPEFPIYQYWYAKALAYNRQIEEACRLFDLIEDTVFKDLGIFFMHALKGEKAKAEQIITRNLKNKAKEDEIFPIWMAESYALIHENQQALEWLEHGIEFGFMHFQFLNQIDPFLENIRGEPRFKKLMEQVKHEWENFEV